MLRIVLADADRVPRGGAAVAVAEFDADLEHSYRVRAPSAGRVELAAAGCGRTERRIVRTLRIGAVEEAILVVVDAVVADLNAEVYAAALTEVALEDGFGAGAVHSVAPPVAHVDGAVGGEGAARRGAGIRDTGAGSVAVAADVAFLVELAAGRFRREGLSTPTDFRIARTLEALAGRGSGIGGGQSSDAFAVEAEITRGARVAVVAPDAHAIEVGAVGIAVCVVVGPVVAVLGTVACEVTHAGEVDETHTTHEAVARRRVLQLLARAVGDHTGRDRRVGCVDGRDRALARAVTPDTQRLLDRVVVATSGRTVGGAVRRLGVLVAAHAGGEGEEDDCREESRGELDRSVGDQPFPGIARHEL